MTRAEDTGGEAVAEHLDALTANMRRIEELSQRLVAALASREPSDAGLQGPGSDLYLKATSAYLAEMMAHPQKLIGQQAAFWSNTLAHYIEAQKALASGQFAAPEDPTPDDKRFANPLWKTHPFFNFVKQQYMISAEAVRHAVENLEGLSPEDRRRVAFFSRQLVDLFAPTNYLATNPDALERAVETDGESLVAGLENLVRDIEARRGELLPTLADPSAFKVGGNLGTTPGKVVFRNRLMEVIQYEPTTRTQARVPVVLFPPWINKFYILDLRETNSFVRHVIDQGFSLFMVSWKNPDASHADIGLSDYVADGYLAAIRQVKAITGETQVNAIGYCIAGTVLAATLGVLRRRGDTSVRSATFFTTLTDFADQGEFTAFLQDDFVDGIEREVAQKGYLDSYFMSRTMSYLRANDLVYAPAVRSYMLGEPPPAFDLLYWNGDSTNLPGRMVVEYLRELCQANRLAEGGFEVLGETVGLRDVTVPICAIACESDHIAPWRDSFRGIARMASRSKAFICSESGHIAGIVNPPSKKKYGHYAGPPVRGAPEDWLAAAEHHAGSWWPRWTTWLRKRSGGQVPARVPGADGREILCEAPGRYVLEGHEG